MFQRRHYELIARTIRELDCNAQTIESVALQFAHALQGTNPQFHRDRFIEACKPNTTRIGPAHDLAHA